MEPREFTAALLDEMNAVFAALGEREALAAEANGQVEVVPLLRLALGSELEASELAGAWVATTPELDAKLAFAHQCGDEMKHFRLIRDRLEALGDDVERLDPLPDGYSPLYRYLQGLTTTVERAAGGLFASEAVAQVRNRQFIELCRSVGDGETAALYADVIQPEEERHHREGRALLETYATTPELQQAAAAATRSTLAIADELRTLTEMTTGMHSIPTS